MRPTGGLMTRELFRARWLFIWRTVAFFAPFIPTNLDDMLAAAMMSENVVAEVEKTLVQLGVIKDEAPPQNGDSLTWPTSVPGK